MTDEEQSLHREIGNRWLDALRHTRATDQNTQTLCQTSAAPDLYVRTFKLDRWQKIFFPIVNWRLSKELDSQVSRSSGDSSSLLSAEKTIGLLEFGDKIESPLVRMSVRKHIIFYKLSNWSVRQAFNSLAIRKLKSGLEIRPQPAWLYWLGTIGFYVGATSWILLIGLLFWDAAFTTLSLSEIEHICLLIQFLIFFCAACYRIGPQWNKGEFVLRRLLDRNSLS